MYGRFWVFTEATKDWVSGLHCLVEQVTESLPAIYQTPENAMNSMNWNGSTIQTKPYLGGSVMTRNNVRISVRELLDLLAGKLEQKTFVENHGTGNANIFSIFRSHGKMITEARVEHRPDDDDDWMVLEFSAGDPAVSEFRVPKSGESPQGEQR